MRRLQSLGVLALGCTCFVGKFHLDALALTSRRPLPTVTLAKAEYQARSTRRFSLGFDNLLAAVLWVQLLQKASHEKLGAGEVSWEYSQINAILELDPNFQRAYDFGSSFLSVFRRDKVGAKKILERWVRNNPRSWKAHYVLAYHLYAEMGDYANAAPIMLKAASLEKAPGWLSALGVRLVSESGALLSALQLAIELYDSARETESKDRVALRIRSLRFALERDAWTRSLTAFRREKRKEPSRLSDLLIFRNAQTREVASFTSHVTIPDELNEIFAEHFEFKYDPQRKNIQAILRPEDAFLLTTGIYRPRE